ncbi:hypothetical protein Tco_0869619, partial [Tanacetum coccineum]
MPRPIRWADNDPLLSHGRNHKARLITLWLHGLDASTRHGLLSLEESRTQSFTFHETTSFDGIVINDELSLLIIAYLGIPSDHDRIPCHLLTALICEYLDWAQLRHTLQVVFAGSQSQASSGGRRSITPEQDSLSSFDSRNRRSSSSSVVWGLPPLGRQIPSSQASSRRGGSSNSSYKKYDYNRRYDGDDSEDIMQTSAALENLQLDRKTRNLTHSWRQIPSSQALVSRRGGSSNSSYKKDDYNRRYDGDDSENIMQTSTALENLQLDRKT